MKKLLILALLASGGCGATVDLPTAGSDPERQRSKPAIAGVAGTYVGQDTCTTIAAQGGAVIGIGTEQFQITTTFSSEGIPLAQSIDRPIGENPEVPDGQFTTTCTTTDVSIGDHSVVIRELCEQLVNGLDSCEFAFNGQCDEPLICSWSTDFADCGPIRWDLEKTTTYLFPFDGTVFRSVSQVLVEAEIGNDSLSTECNGELHRQSTP